MTLTPSAALEEARRFIGLQRYADAERLVATALRDDPGSLPAWILRAQLMLQADQNDAAMRAAAAAVSLAPFHPEAHYLLGRALKAQGRFQAAIDSYLRGARYSKHPGLYADILTSTGVSYRALGRSRDAAAAYHLALARAPEHPAARANLATLRYTMSEEERRDAVQAAAELERRMIADAEAERAQALRRQGRLAEAQAVILSALERVPATASLLSAAAEVAHASGKGGGALLFFDRLLQLEPDNVPVLETARVIAVGAGLTERVQAYSRKLIEIAPSDEVRIGMCLSLPAIQESVDSIHATRRKYETGLDALLAAELSVTNPFSAVGVLSFFLAYHGLNDRNLQVKTARLFAQSMPALRFEPSTGLSRSGPRTRIRVGFLSRFFCAHSIGNTSYGLVEKLDRERFEVVVIRLTPGSDDPVTARFRAVADRVVEIDCDRGLDHAQGQLLGLDLDVLFYQEIGLDIFTYFLAFARVAPVQCVSYGDPNTTGIPNVDYFISNDLYETDESPSHYSERLFLLHDLPTLAYYYRPRSDDSPPSRAAFGLPDDANLYVCPQTLFKMHPEFDPILAGILRRDPRARIVLIRGEFPEWVERLTARFRRGFADVVERVTFLPTMAWPKFMQLLKVSDVMLDTLHFNGMNSSLEGFSVGLPIVTLPTGLQRGRHTRAMYLKMGITDCMVENPDDYIDLAVRLGTDTSFNRQVRERILARNGCLYEDPQVVREFDRFFEIAVATRLGAESRISQGSA